MILVSTALRNHRNVRRAWILLSTGLLMIPFARAAACQQLPHAKITVSPAQGAPGPSDGEDGQSSQREEMLKAVEIKRRELSYQENLEKAKEGAQLGAALLEAFDRQKVLGAAELKKLSRLERLARSIREEAGGGEDDSPLEDAPGTLEAALKKLAELSDELRKRVEKTPKHVVSAAVIGQSNRLLALIRHIKALGS